jgi:hypothetical protein
MNPVPTVPPSAPVDPGQAVREAQELLQAELQKVRAEVRTSAHFNSSLVIALLNFCCGSF